MSEISIKFFMPMKVASTGKEGSLGDVGKAMEELSQSLKEKKVKLAGSAMRLFHGDPKAMDPRTAQYELCVPISGRLKGASNVKDKELEKGAFACITHTGSLDNLQESYKAVLKWIGENGYQIAGAAREVYHKGLKETGIDSQNIVVEVQFPVQK
jgi:effector-binding domain-containing protein